jgi:quercetin dioxygenase-like cupin family protein/iron-sulfur cluster repair protein YtfE (RIC family)
MWLAATGPYLSRIFRGSDAGTLEKMKRHRALIPLSHDHHDALVAARRLRRGADASDVLEAATAFLAFFASSVVPHFREEEELLFPRVADAEEARELVAQALLEHQRLHLAAAELGELVARGCADGATGRRMRELATLLEAHVRLEERQLFPLIETMLSEETLTALENAAGNEGSGPVWGTASEELNATLLQWRAGEGPPEHVNEERDVLVVVLTGSATVSADGDEHELAAGDATIIAKGQRRKIEAGREGVRYLSVHRRRAPLQIAPAPARHG